MAVLYIVRHGNTFDPGETVRRVGARTDLPLSASGEMQAAALGDHFRNAAIAFNAAYCSPLQRTRQTAEAIAKHTGCEISIKSEPFLTEIDYGPDENQPEEKVIERIGAEALKRWDNDAIAPPGWAVDAANLQNAWRQFFNKASDYGADAHILCVTSNGVARFALDVGKTAAVFPRKLRTGAFGRVRIESGDAPVIDCWDERPA
ncbi:MAG: histidine phosphatase family protein [Pseudomonadota bacterium]